MIKNTTGLSRFNFYQLQLNDKNWHYWEPTHLNTEIYEKSILLKRKNNLKTFNLVWDRFLLFKHFGL